ncbi:unnamed protein product [Enterobius vermicularis]|uniref:CULT domain-containing protein n=1 Tax=Enterobius vermicularis TaxID=51028 RepID=A0A0N4V0M3_ENTVE|nr:unnamed protein product [Enterobius vermicularis]
MSDDEESSSNDEEVLPPHAVEAVRRQERDFHRIRDDGENSDDDDDEDDDEDNDDVDDDEDSSDDTKREPFNINLPSTHQYLHIPRADDKLFDYKPLEANTVISVSIIKLHVVMFPNQLLPFHAADNMTVRQLVEASSKGTLIALKPDFVANSRDIATLIQVVQVSAIDNEGVSIHALGRQRCKIREEHSAINGMRYGEVEVLDDRELRPFIPYDVSRSLARMRMPKKRYVQQILSWLSSWFPNDKIDANLSEVLLQFITLIAQNIADVLMKLYLFHGLSNLDTVKGLTSFSFWVAANIPVDTVIRLALLEESCTDRRIINECLHLRKINRIVCKRCGTFLCSLSDIISISTEGNSALYVNPSGYVHDMFTVSKLNSTTPQGNPSAEFSWFPGYEWTIHNCACCRNFIGWRFTSKSLKPRYFYGISRAMVCPRDRNRLLNEGPRDFADEYLYLQL